MSILPQILHYTIMGGEESKFCTSKHNSTKKCVTKLLRLGLRQEEAEYMFKLLGNQKSVPRSFIQTLWREYLTPELMNTYNNYLVSRSDNKCGENIIDVFAFSSFLSNFIRGTVEDRVEMYSSFLHVTNDEIIRISDLKNYLIQLMKSVLKLMSVREITQYLGWMKHGRDFNDDDLHRWVSASILNASDNEEITTITCDQMSSWLTLNTDVTMLQCYIFFSLYDLDKIEIHKDSEYKSIHCPLPNPEVNVQKNDWRVILNIPSVTFINGHLPTENRQLWRLIYSVDIHGEGFSTVCSLICNKGPTVLIIKDRNNHIFGGYASTSWHVGPKFFGDERCFLFSLQPTMKIYPTLPHNDHFLYLNANQSTMPNGIGMGGQLGYWGLWIDASFEFGSCSPSCSTYAGYKMLSGSPEFGIAGLEVWSAEHSINSAIDGEEDPSKEEAGSILHKDPGARALMDMLGKTGSSRDFLVNG